MKRKYIWIILLSILLYGVLPIKIPNYFDDFALFEKPNILLVSRQECGCPCAEGVILKGTLEYSEKIKKQFPTLSPNSQEITIVNFSPFDDITNENYQTFDFANNNNFKIDGEVIGVDTILCNPENCEIVPKFRVENWSLNSYYARFWLWDITFILVYFALWVIALPSMLIISFVDKKKAKFL